MLSNRNKPRLILALYLRPKHPGSYHYALFVSPKSKPGTATKYHVKNTLTSDSTGAAVQPWQFERLEVDDTREEQRLLVCVVIGKIVAVERIDHVLQAVPIYQVDDEDKVKATSFSCSTWASMALETLERENIVKNLGQWGDMCEQAMRYVDQKKKMGRWDANWKGEKAVPVLDLLTNKESVE